MKIILVLFFLSFINAQIALPTFQAVHTPHTAEASSLYDFTTHTFTNCGATGRNGPTLANCKSSYDVSWEDNTDYFNVPSDAGIQYWTVPETGTYTIEVWGAQGGDAHSDSPGFGARIRGDFTLTQGEIIHIVVGQQGLNQTTASSGSNYYSGGGGGGTFVIKTPYNNTASILVIAGGGGGSGYSSVSESHKQGRTETTGGIANGSTTQATNGAGGYISDRDHVDAAGGGGFSGNGQDGTVGSTGGQSFTNGAVGGTGGGNNGDQGEGGFGGGGGQSNDNVGRAGGAGGYSGGSGGDHYGYGNAGGGGGSYNSGSNQSNSAGIREDHGQIIITIN